jgi:hypothetical protein
LTIDAEAKAVLVVVKNKSIETMRVLAKAVSGDVSKRS